MTAPAIIPDTQEVEVRPLRAEGHSNLETFTDRVPAQSGLSRGAVLKQTNKQASKQTNSYLLVRYKLSWEKLYLIRKPK